MLVYPTEVRQRKVHFEEGGLTRRVECQVAIFPVPVGSLPARDEVKHVGRRPERVVRVLKGVVENLQI